MAKLRERLQKQLFQVGAEVQRGSLFGRLRRENDPKEMSAIVEHLLYENLMFHHRHFTMALNSLGRSSLWPLALDLLPEMQHRDLVPNTITYNAAMDACRKGHAWEHAADLIQDMDAATARPDLVTYSTVMSACDKASNWALALLFFDSLLASSMVPDAACISSAITACSRAARWELAVGFVEEMRIRQQIPDLHCHNGIINAMGVAKRWQEALEYFHQLSSTDVVSYNTTMAAMSESHQWQKALQIFETCSSNSGRPNVISFNSAITACWIDKTEDRSDLAKQIQAEMQEQRVAPGVDTFRALIQAQAVGSHWQRVITFLEEMQEMGLGHDSETLRLSMEVLIQKPEAKSDALRLYRQVEGQQLKRPARPSTIRKPMEAAKKDGQI